MTTTFPAPLSSRQRCFFARGTLQLLFFTSIALTLAAFTGCSTSGLPKGMDPPEISLSNIRPGPVNFFESTIYLSLRYHNPNSQQLKVSGSKFDFLVNGEKIGKGVSHRSFALDSFSETVTEIPVRMSNLSFLQQLLGMIDNTGFEYDLVGKVGIERFGGTTLVPIETGGVFSPPLTKPSKIRQKSS